MGRQETFSAIAQAVRDRLLSGQYQPGQQLPTEQRLAAEFRRSRCTIRKALALLRQEGSIQSVVGRGHFLPGGCISAETHPDIGLAIGINRHNWGPEIGPVRLHELLEERVERAHGRLFHLQTPIDGTPDEVIEVIARCPASNLVIEERAWPTRLDTMLFADALQRIGKRCVAVAWQRPAVLLPITHIYVDWAQGARQMVRHLLDQGRQHIVFAGFDGIAWSDDRLAAVLGELRSAGRWPKGQPPPHVPFPIRPDLDSAHAPIPLTAIDAVAGHVAAWRLSHPVDAIICANDALAERLVDGHAVPLAGVCGFDNSVWARQHGVMSPGIPFTRIADAILRCLWGPVGPGPVQLVDVAPLVPRRLPDARPPRGR